MSRLDRLKTTTPVGNRLDRLGVGIGVETIEEKPIKRFQISQHLGGGSYISSGDPNELVKEDRSYGGIPTKTGYERDHIIPVALGGGSDPYNIQYLRSTTQQAKDRQEGKMVEEWEIMSDYDSGKISLREAQAEILRVQRQIKGIDPKQGVSSYIGQGIKDAPREILNRISSFFKSIPQKLQQSWKETNEKYKVPEVGRSPLLDYRINLPEIGQKFYSEYEEAFGSPTLARVKGADPTPLGREMTSEQRAQIVRNWTDFRIENPELAESLLKEGEAEFMSRTAKGTTAPVRLFSGYLAKFITEFTFERMDTDLDYQPTDEIEKLFTGEQPWRRISESKEIEGSIFRFLNKQKPVNVGGIEVDVNMPMAGSLMVGAVINHPFIQGTSGFFKSIRGEASKLMGKRLFGDIASEIPKVLPDSKLSKITSPEIAQREVNNVIAEALKKNNDPIFGVDVSPAFREQGAIKEILNNRYISKMSSDYTDVWTDVIKSVDDVYKGRINAEPKIIREKIEETLIKITRENPQRFVGEVAGAPRVEPAIGDLMRKYPDLTPDNIAMRTTRDGKQVPMIRKESGVYTPKAFETQDFRDYGGLTDTLTSMTHTADDINVLKTGKFGALSDISESVYTKIARRGDFVDDSIRSVMKVFSDNKIKATKKNNKIVFDILDGQSPKIAKAGHYNVAGDIRSILDNLRDQANIVRKAMGKPEIGYIDNYAPHMKRTSAWQKLIQRDKTTISDNLDFIIPNQANNPFAKKRLGEMIEKETNLAKVLDQYIKAISNDIHITPAIEQLKGVSQMMLSRDKTKISNFLNRYIRENLTGKVSGIDAMLGVRHGTLTREALGLIQRARVLGALAGNIGWMILTMPMSMANTLMKTGLRNTLSGIAQWTFNPARRAEIRELASMRIKSGRGIARTGFGDLDKAHQKIYRTRIDKWNDFLNKFPDALEYHLTGASMSAGIQQAKRYKMGKEATFRYADYIGQVTQSMYNAEHRTQALNSLIVRTAFPFQTFSMEMFRHIKNIAGVGGGIPLTVKQRLSHAINLVVGTMMVNAIHQKFKGRNLQTPGTFIPLVGQPVEEKVKDMTGAVTGQAPEYRSPRSPVAPLQDINNLQRAFTDISQYGDYNRLRKELIFWSMGLSGAGGAGQVNKMIDGLIASEQEQLKNAKGDMLFEIKEPREKFRAIIHGPWGTQAGIDYWKNDAKETNDIDEIEQRIIDDLRKEILKDL